MQCVVAVILGNVVRLAVELERSACDTVRIATDNGPHVRLVAGRDVTVQTVKALDDVRHLAVAVGSFDGLHDSAVGKNPDRELAVL